MKKFIAIAMLTIMLCVFWTLPCFAEDGVETMMEWGAWFSEIFLRIQQAALANAGSITQAIYSVLLGVLTFLSQRSNKKTRIDIGASTTGLTKKATTITNAVTEKLNEVKTALACVVDTVAGKLDEVIVALKDVARENRKLRAEVRENNVYWRENMKYSQLTELHKKQIIDAAEAARNEILGEVTTDEGDHEA